MSFKGRCSCGAVQYSVSGEPVLQGNCHCRECQRMTGSAYSATLFFPEPTVTITGTFTRHTRKGESGKNVSMGFCTSCGSPLFGFPEFMPGLIGIRAGSLDDTSNYKPSMDIFASRAASWEHMDPSLPKFAELPPMS